MRNGAPYLSGIVKIILYPLWKIIRCNIFKVIHYFVNKLNNSSFLIGNPQIKFKAGETQAQRSLGKRSNLHLVSLC